MPLTGSRGAEPLVVEDPTPQREKPHAPFAEPPVPPKQLTQPHRSRIILHNHTTNKTDEQPHQPFVRFPIHFFASGRLKANAAPSTVSSRRIFCPCISNMR